MIYAPPSREKSKQTVRSPMLEKAKTTSIGSQLVPSDEYSAPVTYQQQHTSNTAGGQRKKTGPNGAPYAASGSQSGVGAQGMMT